MYFFGDGSMRESLLDFFWMFLVIVSYSSLRKLHSTSQGVLEIVIDSIGMAAIFSVLMYFSKKKRAN
jgi:hypothetical protein